LQLIELEKDDDMKLDEIYKEGSKGIGVRFIQMVLNRDMNPEPLLKVDGIWGPKTNAVVLAYQEKHNLSQYGGAIGPNTMQDMVKEYPDIWDNIQYKYAIGIR
jgi:peptidoglycan hydrolase-like protein with peptidoglycan-binding domain